MKMNSTAYASRKLSLSAAYASTENVVAQSDRRSPSLISHCKILPSRSEMLSTIFIPVFKRGLRINAT